jgi:hypothetical protein
MSAWCMSDLQYAAQRVGSGTPHHPANRKSARMWQAPCRSMFSEGLFSLRCLACLNFCCSRRFLADLVARILKRELQGTGAAGATVAEAVHNMSKREVTEPEAPDSAQKRQCRASKMKVGSYRTFCFRANPAYTARESRSSIQTVYADI